MEYQIRRSFMVRFEAGYKDMNCKFFIHAKCKPGYPFWHVMKVILGHTCTPDVYDSHFRSVKAIIMKILFSKRVASGDYKPKMVMGELLE